MEQGGFVGAFIGRLGRFPSGLLISSSLFFLHSAKAFADWTLNESSRIGFVSIKNNNIGENFRGNWGWHPQ